MLVMTSLITESMRAAADDDDDGDDDDDDDDAASYTEVQPDCEYLPVVVFQNMTMGRV
jgi:hypothetical protein